MLGGLRQEDEWVRGGGQCSSTADISTTTNTSIDTTTCSSTSTTNGEGLGAARPHAGVTGQLG